MRDFFDACIQRDFPLITKYLQGNKQIVNSINEYGDTPIIITTYQGYYSLTGLLLVNGADPNYKNAQGIDCLMIACYHGNNDIIDLLIEAKVSITEVHVNISKRNKETFEKIRKFYEEQNSKVFL